MKIGFSKRGRATMFNVQCIMYNSILRKNSKIGFSKRYELLAKSDCNDSQDASCLAIINYSLLIIHYLLVLHGEGYATAHHIL